MLDTTFSLDNIKTAMRLANVGMANASSALSFMVGETVRFTPVVSGELPPMPMAEEGQLSILLTPFIGDVLQEGYLILQPSHAQRLADSLLPSPGKDDNVRNAALLEIDNIMSASIATRLGDTLDLMVMGDVPRLMLKTPEETALHIANRITQTANQLHCYAIFKAARMNVEAIYICLFKPKFLGALQKCMEKEEAVKLLNEQEKASQVYIEA